MWGALKRAFDFGILIGVGRRRGHEIRRQADGQALEELVYRTGSHEDILKSLNVHVETLSH